MTDVIGMPRRATGGLGNQLFQFHFLNRVAEILDCSVSTWGSSYATDFLGVEPRGRIYIPQLLMNAQRYSLQDLDALGWDQFILEAKDVIASGKHISFGPGILGSQFFESAREPTALIDFRVPLKHRADGMPLRIGVHFRGTDFYSWDASAVLPPTFYETAWEYVVSAVGDQPIEVVMRSDDRTLESVKRMESVTGAKVVVGQHATKDLRELAQCDWIIAPPSTFSFWAGVLGRSLCVQSGQWIERRANQGHRFWQNIAAQDRDSSIYRLAALI